MSDPQVPLQETLMALSGQRKKKVDNGGTGYAPESPREYGSVAPSHIPEPGTAEDRETKSREWERQVDQPIESEDPISDGIMAADGIGALVRGATLSKIAEQMARAKSKSAGAKMTDGMGFAPVEMAARSPVDATELMGHDDIRRMLAANEHPGAVSIGPQMAGMSGDDVMSHLGYEAPAAPDFEQRWKDLFEHLDKPKDKSFVPQAPFDRATPTPGGRDISLGDPSGWSEQTTGELMKKLSASEPTNVERGPLGFPRVPKNGRLVETEAGVVPPNFEPTEAGVKQPNFKPASMAPGHEPTFPGLAPAGDGMGYNWSKTQKIVNGVKPFPDIFEMLPDSVRETLPQGSKTRGPHGVWQTPNFNPDTPIPRKPPKR